MKSRFTDICASISTGRRKFSFFARFAFFGLLIAACAHQERNPPKVTGPLDPAWVPGSFGEPGPATPGSWKTDARGDRFYVVRIPNDPARYRWIDPETIRFGSVAAYKVDHVDGTALYVRFYEAKNPAPPDVPAKREASTTGAELIQSDRFSFVSFGEGLPRSGQWRNGFAVGDINGDGFPDIVHGPARKSGGPPVILLGDGKGRWRRDAFVHFPPLPYDYGDAAVADFNGDGKLDIALGIHLRGLAVLVNDGHGGFVPWSEGLDLRQPNAAGGAPHFSSRAIASVDWNGDGRPDLVALSDGPRPGGGAGIATSLGFRVYLNRGDGSWTTESESDDRVFGDSLAVGDVDGDGHPDAVTATGFIGFRRILKHGMGNRWENREINGLPTNALVRAVALGDFDRDGRMDVVISYSAPDAEGWRSGIDLFLSTKEGFVRRQIVSELSREGYGALATGDLNGDGALDLVAARADGSVHTFAGNGKGFLTRDHVIPAPVFRRGCGGTHVVLADLDGDGRDEIVASFAGERDSLSGSVDCPSGGAIEAWKLKDP